MLTYTFRLKPGQDLFLEISTLRPAIMPSRPAACSPSLSLAHALIRLADRGSPSDDLASIHLMIVPLIGTIHHTVADHILHVSISDGARRTLGGPDLLRAPQDLHHSRDRPGSVLKRCGHTG